MNLRTRINLLSRLGDYLQNHSGAYKDVQQRAWAENKWFTPDYISLAGGAVAKGMLASNILGEICERYQIPDYQLNPKTIGLVMAGNIPFVGLQDLIAVFLSAHRLKIKPSSKDTVLVKHILTMLTEIEPEVAEWINNTQSNATERHDHG